MCWPRPEVPPLEELWLLSASQGTVPSVSQCCCCRLQGVTALEGWLFARTAELSSTQAPDPGHPHPSLDPWDLPAAPGMGPDPPPPRRADPGSHTLLLALLPAWVLTLGRTPRDGVAPLSAGQPGLRLQCLDSPLIENREENLILSPQLYRVRPLYKCMDFC